MLWFDGPFSSSTYSHAQFKDTDAKRKERIEAVNHADSVVHDTEKNLTEHKDRLAGISTDALKEKIAALRAAIKAEDSDSEALRQLTNEVQQASMKVFEGVYKVCFSLSSLSSLSLLYLSPPT